MKRFLPRLLSSYYLLRSCIFVFLHGIFLCLSFYGSTDLSAGSLYVSAQSGGNLVIIDTVEDKLQTLLDKQGSVPVGLAKSPDRSKLYITDYTNNHLLILDEQTHKILKKIPVGLNPVGVLASLDDKKVYVVNSGSSSISIIDTYSQSVTHSIFIGYVPIGIASIEHDKLLYVTNYSSKGISIIDTQTLGVRLVAQDIIGPIGIATTQNGKYAYIASNGSKNLCLLETATNTVVKTASGFQSPYAVALNEIQQEVYVTDYKAGLLYILDFHTLEILHAVNVGNGPTCVVIDPKGTKAYVANHSSHTVSVIDTSSRKVIKTIDVKGSPMHLLLLTDEEDPPFDRKEIEKVEVVYDLEIETAAEPMSQGEFGYVEEYTESSIFDQMPSEIAEEFFIELPIDLQGETEERDAINSTEASDPESILPPFSTCHKNSSTHSRKGLFQSGQQSKIHKKGLF